MKQATVYLAGPIAGLNYAGATEWRELLTNRFGHYGIKALSPMRGTELLRNMQELSGHLRHEAALDTMATPRAVVTRDRFDVERCDVLLVNLMLATKVSIGTMFEIAWAYQLHKPIVVVMEPEGNLHDHAFVNEAAGFRASDLNSACDIVRGIIG